MKAFMKKCPLVMVTIVIALVVAATVVVKSFAFPAAGNKAQETHGNVSSSLPQSAVSSSCAPSNVAGSSKTVSSAGSAASHMQHKPGSSAQKRASGFKSSGKEYFSDALFVGDSLTEGFKDYGGIDNASYFCHVGLSIYQLFEHPKTDFSTGLTLEQTLRKKKYGKIYMLLGINEIGTGSTDYFVRHYSNAVTKIRSLQPDAVIYIQSILYVTPSKASGESVFNNTNVRKRNSGLKTLADGKNVFYLNIDSAIDDGNGNMHEEYSGDGVHLKAKYYPLLSTYIEEHTV